MLPNHPPNVLSESMASGDSRNPDAIEQFSLAYKHALRNLCLLPGVFQPDVLYPSAPYPSPDFPPPNQYETPAHSPGSTRTPSPVPTTPSGAGNFSTQPISSVQLPPASNRGRVVFSDKQREVFNSHFARNTHPTKEEKQEIVRETGLTWEQVTDWFKKNNYIKRRKMAVENQKKGVPSAPKLKGFSEEQRVILRKHFADNQNPKSPLRASIALETGLTEVQVKSWFKAERAREKAAPGRGGRRVGSD